MQDSRRQFFALSLGLAAAAALTGGGICAAQQQTTAPPYDSSKSGPSDRGPDLPNRGNTTKSILEANQADIKRNVEKLYDLASQLRDQVNSTDSTAVLSMAMVKKAEEIEKLAKQIKERAKG